MNGSELAAQPLASQFNDSDVMIRRHAVNALGEIGEENAIVFLKQASYDLDEFIRVNANSILYELSLSAGN